MHVVYYDFYIFLHYQVQTLYFCGVNMLDKSFMTIDSHIRSVAWVQCFSWFYFWIWIWSTYTWPFLLCFKTRFLRIYAIVFQVAISMGTSVFFAACLMSMSEISWCKDSGHLLFNSCVHPKYHHFFELTIEDIFSSFFSSRSFFVLVCHINQAYTNSENVQPEHMVKC